MAPAEPEQRGGVRDPAEGGQLEVRRSVVARAISTIAMMSTARITTTPVITVASRSERAQRGAELGDRRLLSRSSRRDAASMPVRPPWDQGSRWWASVQGLVMVQPSAAQVV